MADTNHPHTPGPWNLDDDDLSIFADVGAAICKVMGADDFPCIESGTEDDVQAECLANARIIAAAPDLYAALHEFAGLYCQDAPGVADLQMRVSVILAKARGEA